MVDLLAEEEQVIATATCLECVTCLSPEPPRRGRPLAQLSDVPSLTFHKHPKNGRLLLPPKPGVKLRNNLLKAVGYIELANAGDFAANVFNMHPIPVYAIVLMAIGGTVSLAMLYFVVKDGRLSWQNIQGLRAERRFLLQEKRKLGQGPDKDDGKAHERKSLECLLHVNHRDLGAQAIERFAMDVLLGFGALVVGAGTYLAIAGNDPAIFSVSNLLTGYIGNSPIAVYGLVNMGWSVLVWMRAKQHGTVVTAASDANLDVSVKRRLQVRKRRVQLHGMLNGVTGVIAGAASLVTATQWWAYVILGLCISVSAYCNRLWRYHVGYDRPFFVRTKMLFTDDEVVKALKGVDEMFQSVEDRRKNSADDVESGVDPTMVLVPAYDGSLRCLLEFIAYMNLFEDFCIRLVGNKELMSQLDLYPKFNSMVRIDSQKLLKLESLAGGDQLVQLARDTINHAVQGWLRYRERWLLELLGCYMAFGTM